MASYSFTIQIEAPDRESAEAAFDLIDNGVTDFANAGEFHDGVSVGVRDLEVGPEPEPEVGLEEKRRRAAGWVYLMHDFGEACVSSDEEWTPDGDSWSIAIMVEDEEGSLSEEKTFTVDFKIDTDVVLGKYVH